MTLYVDTTFPLKHSVRNEHVARISSKVDDCIWRSWYQRPIVASEVEVCGEGVENLTAVGKVSLKSEDIWVVQWNKIQVKDFMSFLEQLRNNVSPRFSRTPCEHNALAWT